MPSPEVPTCPPCSMPWLQRTGRPGEPSWGVLAHLVRETRFVQTYRRLDFLRLKPLVPVDDFWDLARALSPATATALFLESLRTVAQDARQTGSSALLKHSTLPTSSSRRSPIQDLGLVDPLQGREAVVVRP